MSEQRPSETMNVSEFWVGDCVVELVGGGTARERVVVTQADPHVMASSELVDDWLSGVPHVTVDSSGERPIARFGTDSEGLGVVAYEIGEMSAQDVTFSDPKRFPAPAEWVTLRRVA